MRCRYFGFYANAEWLCYALYRHHSRLQLSIDFDDVFLLCCRRERDFIFMLIYFIFYIRCILQIIYTRSMPHYMTWRSRLAAAPSHRSSSKRRRRR